MLVLDTNVMSEVIGPAPSHSVLRWFGSMTAERLGTTVVCLAELKAGLAVVPEGRRRTSMLRSLERLSAPTTGFFILEFNEEATDVFARMYAARRRAGLHIGTPDLMIAAICHVEGATLATRNVSDFEATGIDVVNPWDSGSA